MTWINGSKLSEVDLVRFSLKNRADLVEAVVMLYKAIYKEEIIITIHQLQVL